MRRLVALVMLAGCSSSTTGGEPGPADAGAAIAPEDVVFGGDRPVGYFRAPEGHDPKSPLPLVMVLHGFGAGGYVQALYFRLEKIMNEKKFLLVAPEGTPSPIDQRRFWNAVDVCCDFGKTGVDDVKYLTGLIDEIAKTWAVDRKRVYLVGHSNGGAMAYRLACDAASKIAAVVTLAPPFYTDRAKCNPTEPVAVRHMHGTADELVPYEGGTRQTEDPNRTATYPSAAFIAESWATWNGCSPTPDQSAAPIDFDNVVTGAETKISRYSGCKPNGDVELWTMEGSKHAPFDLSADLPTSIWSFLSAHAKP